MARGKQQQKRKIVSISLYENFYCGSKWIEKISQFEVDFNGDVVGSGRHPALWGWKFLKNRKLSDSGNCLLWNREDNKFKSTNFHFYKLGYLEVFEGLILPCFIILTPKLSRKFLQIRLSHFPLSPKSANKIENVR